jgi:endonuclease-3
MPARPEPPADPSRKDQSRRVVRALARLYPEALCALTHSNPFELLVATILSAQCTDARVNLVTPALFARYPDPAALAAAEPSELEGLIHSTGFFRAKARSLLGMARGLVERHGGAVPADLDALTALPGVGRKTANVVMGTAFGLPSGVVVDTHVKRLSYRLGLTDSADPVAIERDLIAVVPRKEWIALSHRLILHGRAVCAARKPACERCELAAFCPRRGVAGAARLAE